MIMKLKKLLLPVLAMAAIVLAIVPARAALTVVGPNNYASTRQARVPSADMRCNSVLISSSAPTLIFSSDTSRVGLFVDNVSSISVATGLGATSSLAVVALSTSSNLSNPVYTNYNTLQLWQLAPCNNLGTPAANCELKMLGGDLVYNGALYGIALATGAATISLPLGARVQACDLH